MSTPNSTITVYHNVPLDNTYRNVVHGGIDNEEIGGYAKHTWTSQTWCRIVGLRNNKVRVDLTYSNGVYSDELFDCNYISIQNREYKTIYGFITDILYISDNVAEITFEIDVFHTYYSDYEFGECIIERRTITDDTEGDYTLKEPVDLGNEYVINDQFTIDLSQCDLIIQTGLPRTESDMTRAGGMWNVGIHIYGIDRNCSAAEMNGVWAQIGTKTLLACYYCPTLFARSNGAGTAFRNEIYDSNYASNNYKYGIGGALDGYVPKHKKLLCYPYRYVEVTNMQGQRQIYKLENFDNPLSIEFVLLGVAYPSPYGYLYPKNYNGVKYAFDYGIPLQSFASNMMNSETMDYYWGTHKNHIIMNTASEGISGATSGAASGAAIGSMFGGIGAIPGAIAGAVGGGLGGLAHGGIKEYANVQDISNTTTGYIGGGNTDNINVVSGFCGFHVNIKSIRSECAKAIDDFFTRYGYKYERLGTPPIDGQYRFRYIQTRECNLKNISMPTWAASMICEIHDKGVTYWNSLSNIGTYYPQT